ncbi:MAG: PadR family transcriptional regulator, partial [Gemmatimonadota bacterium]|nr:PadR family transcriptional regulator [Gemmatimonadota bacterium]
LVLLAVARRAEAYGVTVRREIEKTSGRGLSMTAVYGALERLEERGLLESEMSRPTPERGGRRKRVYRVLPPGAEAMARARRGLERMWDGVPMPEPGAVR